MKTIISKLVVVALLLSSLTISSCASDDDNNQEQTGQQISQIKSILTSGTWIITEYIDSGTDETNHFAGFNFTFNNNGVLTADKASESYEGTWSITNSNSDDDSTDDLDFNIAFNVSNDLDDLTDDWNLLSHSSNKIELIDISGGNGGTDSVTFEKN